MKQTASGMLRRWSLAVFGAAAFTIALPPAVSTLNGIVGTDVSFSSASAQEKKKRKTRRTPAIDGKLFKEMEKVQLAIEAKNYSEAIGILNKLRDRTGKKALNPYELANLYNLYAFVYFTQENYGKALEAYRNVIRQSPNIPEAMEVSTRFTIAQLYFVQEKWKSGMNELNKWFAAKKDLGEPIGANSYALRAQGYYQLKNFNAALRDIEYAIADYKGKGKLPKEQWYGLQRFLYYDKGNINKVISILEETLKYYQKKAYWVQLAAMYGDRKREKEMVAAMETAYVQGLLEKEKELINMSYMYLSQDVPWKAAKTIDKGMKRKQIQRTSKNLELLGNSFRHAQEVKRAIPVMAAAAKKSDKGELYARLGNIYLDNDEFQKAANAVRAGLKKGGIKRPDTAWLVLGMAAFNLEEYDEARRAFNEAKKSERSEKYAVQWIEFMDREIARQKSLAADLEASEAAKAEAESDAT